jgi:hypothetical protein
MQREKPESLDDFEDFKEDVIRLSDEDASEYIKSFDRFSEDKTSDEVLTIILAESITMTKILVFFSTKLPLNMRKDFFMKINELIKTAEQELSNG